MFEICLDELPQPEDCGNPGMTAGCALYAFFVCEAARRLQRTELYDLARSYVERAAELVNSRKVTTSLYAGIPAVAWAVHRVCRDRNVDGAEEYLDDVNSLLAQTTASLMPSADIDIINGVAGVVTYASRCCGDAQLLKILAGVEVWLEAVFPYWRESELRMADKSRSQHVNLGYAHGIPGLLGALAHAVKRGALRPQTSQLVRDGFNYVWRFAVLDRDGGAYLPHFQDKVTIGRAAWCYGSPGASLSFLNASSMWTENIERANSLIESSLSQIGNATAQIYDASLCHGSAGAAFLCSVFEMNDKVDQHLRARAKDAALQLSRMTLAKGEWENKSLRFPYSSLQGMRYDDSFLEGRLGVVLALDALDCPTRPEWAGFLGLYF